MKNVLALCLVALLLTSCAVDQESTMTTIPRSPTEIICGASVLIFVTLAIGYVIGRKSGE